MLMRLVSAVALVACSGSAKSTLPVKPAGDTDPDGPHRARIAAHVKPLIDAELVGSVVVGIIDGGKREIYGFGSGPGGKPPNGATLFELGSITKVYTGLLLADSVQRREVALDTPIAELLPTGVTAPTRDKLVITLRHLALHSSGLPPYPPSLRAEADNPFAHYPEDQLYQDLVQTQLIAPPGSRIVHSDYGYGVLAHELGRKIGGGFVGALQTRVLTPLKLDDTMFAVPKSAQPRLAIGTNDDLAPVKGWTYDSLTGTGGLISSVRDQLALIEAELDADAGSRAPLRPAMKLTQEAQLERVGDNAGLGWQIDSAGRYWHVGETGGYHAFVGFDPKTRRGVVVLASTNSSLIESLPIALYGMLANEDVKPPVFPDTAALAPLAGTYDFPGTKLTIVVAGKRLYLQGPGAPKYRIVPVSESRFWIEGLQSGLQFEKEGDQIKSAVFVIPGRGRISAPRVDPAAPLPRVDKATPPSPPEPKKP
jgi:serine-type D-Ala-D-Ala carboxypeptidase/endopeptidase